MIAIDTNVLVAAHRRDAAGHDRAAAAVRSLAEGTASFAIPWPCLHEFIAVVTHPRIFPVPSTVVEALDQLAAWLAAPTLLLLAEQPGYAAVLRNVLATSQVTGPRVHDARIAALCAQHGVAVIWTADRDFSRFPRLQVQNPLVDPMFDG